MRRREFLIGASGLLAAPAVAAPVKPVRPAPRMVVIDAGHGGVDPGAIGPSGVNEKRITLAVATQLAKRLEASGRYQPVLTRRDDQLIPLAERVLVARRQKAQLFMSLHADSVPHNPAARGLSVYTLAEDASDPMAAALAASHNAIERLGDVNLSRHPKQVRSILLDLLHREMVNKSSLMANTVVERLCPPFQAMQNPHRQANFAVLRAHEVPSLLVEMGFLSNRDDERQLAQSSYQAQFAERLLRAIDAYFSHGG